jgi:hypothetical protein
LGTTPDTSTRSEGTPHIDAHNGCGMAMPIRRALAVFSVVDPYLGQSHIHCPLGFWGR